MRKISRSCIANYVRLYKDLRPILRTFTEYGILKNPSAYSKQCVILILPNLLNLDPGVVSTNCAEMNNLTKALIDQLDLGEDELSKSVNKVLSEMLKRFHSFDNIYRNCIQEQHNNAKVEREESKSNSSAKLSNTVK